MRADWLWTTMDGRVIPHSFGVSDTIIKVECERSEVEVERTFHMVGRTFHMVECW